MLEPDVRHVLDSASFAHLATILPDGSPHSTPVYVGAYGDRIVFFTGPGMLSAGRRTGMNLRPRSVRPRREPGLLGGSGKREMAVATIRAGLSRATPADKSETVRRRE